MSCAAIPPSMLVTQVLAKLQQARERVAHGWPSIPCALASGPGATVADRLAAAKAAQKSGVDAPPWVRTLAECLSRVEHARALWGTTPDALPPLAAGIAPCALDLRDHLGFARACAEKHLAWEDSGGLTRPQALCVLHLAVTLAKWDAQQQRATVATHAFQPLPTLRRAPQPSRRPEPASEFRSLRDLARVADAFSDWGEEETDR
ncbi:hypothetical protein [Vitiosangium sp. GDMCC 1.1324]|uniref:hypothetical protein n=1 Tax=Vitiosangium sp. (strain GDMCC 1.1324) TaxID=2138576 RepID=UPI000D39502F|nr:hypothetical protein [Vitiosangium sp. GDMCC 1.1324]PTL79080.1 hypothetical protein DAT35_36335 [Vitiosangium sp. GDMCC 1.1324]